MAHAINLCFLNRYSPIIPRPNLKSISSKHVMIIEDNADHYSLMELFLKQGFPAMNLVHKSSAECALEYFSQSGRAASAAIDLVILDLYLPKRQQGLDLLTSIREIWKEKNLAAVPIVVLSASDNREDMMASYQRQANSYLVKTTEPAKSFSYLTDLCYFWQNTIVSPRKIR
jgi:DNA-binding response OmpR family regulator